MSILANSSFAQSLDDFKTYINDDMAFTIQHPANWLVVEDEKSAHDKVLFKLSNRTMPIFVVTTQKVESYLDPDTMIQKNTSLQEYVQQRQDLLSSLDINYNPIRQDEVTIGGNVGLKVEFSVGDFFTSDIFTIANGKLFELSYHDDPQNVPQNVKLADKMVESFQVNTEDIDSSNGLTFEEYRKKYCPEYSNETQLLVLCSPSELEEPQDMPRPPPQD